MVMHFEPRVIGDFTKLAQKKAKKFMQNNTLYLNLTIVLFWKVTKYNNNYNTEPNKNARVIHLVYHKYYTRVL
jgi:DMSO/TMAO reductase YedYZ molybdopterin-dependent catalytic subunit